MKIVRNGGFTLIELMIGLVVLAVLLAVAAPAFINLIKDNRILSEAYALRAVLDGARSEAISQRSFVTFCRSNDGDNCIGSDWKDGYIAFVDINGDGTVDDPNDPDGDSVFISKVIDSNTLDIEFKDRDGNSQSRIRFGSQGYARSFEGTFTICDDREANYAKGVIITPGGLVRAAQDPNDTGTAVDLGGNALVCP